MALHLIAAALRIAAAGAAAIVLISSAWLRTLLAYRHSFEEMAQGERFVQRTIRNRARDHERFVIGAPAAVLSLACLTTLGYGRGVTRRYEATSQRRGA